MPSETLRYWVFCGRLRAFKPGRRLLFKEQDIVDLVEGSEVGAARVGKSKVRAKKR